MLSSAEGSFIPPVSLDCCKVLLHQQPSCSCCSAHVCTPPGCPASHLENPPASLHALCLLALLRS